MVGGGISWFVSFVDGSASDGYCETRTGWSTTSSGEDGSSGGEGEESKKFTVPISTGDGKRRHEHPSIVARRSRSRIRDFMYDDAASNVETLSDL